MVEMMAKDSVNRDKCLRVVGREKEDKADSDLVPLLVWFCFRLWMNPEGPQPLA